MIVAVWIPHRPKPFEHVDPMIRRFEMCLDPVAAPILIVHSASSHGSGRDDGIDLLEVFAVIF
jgi:hypothetical protein